MTEDPKTPETPEEDPVTLDEPGSGEAADTGGKADRSAVWMRLVYMIIFAILFGIGETILAVGAVLQFGFLLFTGKRNDRIAEFGEKLADWMRNVARFQTVASEDKPFPWSDI